MSIFNFGRKLGMALALFHGGCALACGAPDEYLDAAGIEDEGDAGEQLGSVALPITGKPTTTYQFGVQTGSTKRRCNKTSSGQVCEVPNTVNLKTCTSARSIEGTPLSSSAQIRAEGMRNTLHSVSAFAFNFPFSDTGTLDGRCQLGTTGGGAGSDANIVFVQGAVGSSGTGSNDIKDYVSIEFITGNGTSNLSEQPGVVGSYKSHQFCRVKLDETDIFAKGANSADDNRLLDHASAVGLLGCAGFGIDPNEGDQSCRFTRFAVNPPLLVNCLSAGETCQANGFTLSTPAQYANGTACSSD